MLLEDHVVCFFTLEVLFFTLEVFFFTLKVFFFTLRGQKSGPEEAYFLFLFFRIDEKLQLITDYFEVPTRILAIPQFLTIR